MTIARTLFLCTTVSLFAAGCGNGENNTAADMTTPRDLTPPPDMAMAADLKPADVSCAGDGGVAPMVPAMITVTGKVQNPLNGNKAVQGALIQALLRADDKEVSNVTTPADGSFTLQIPTESKPWDGYLKISKAADATFIPSYIYKSRPLDEDIKSASLPLIRKDDLTLAGNIAKVTPEAGTTTLFISVQDCAEDGVEGATVSIAPSGAKTQIVYFTEVAGSPLPNPKAQATAQEGVALGFNVVGDMQNRATVTATYRGTTWPSSVVGAWKDSLVVTFVTP